MVAHDLHHGLGPARPTLIEELLKAREAGLGSLRRFGCQLGEIALVVVRVRRGSVQHPVFAAGRLDDETVPVGEPIDVAVPAGALLQRRSGDRVAPIPGLERAPRDQHAWDPDAATLTQDETWSVRYARPGQSYGWDPVVEGGELWWLDNGEHTYTTSMAYVMEEAARRRVPVVVLDRPNPINGYQVEGPALDEGISHFAAYFFQARRTG